MDIDERKMRPPFQSHNLVFTCDDVRAKRFVSFFFFFLFFLYNFFYSVKERFIFFLTKKRQSSPSAKTLQVFVLEDPHFNKFCF